MIEDLPEADYLATHDSIEVDLHDTFDKLLLDNDTSNKENFQESKNKSKSAIKNKSTVTSLSIENKENNQETEATNKANSYSTNKKRTLDISIDNSLSYYVETKKTHEETRSFNFLRDPSFNQLSRSNYSGIFEDLHSKSVRVLSSTPLKIENRGPERKAIVTVETNNLNVIDNRNLFNSEEQSISAIEDVLSLSSNSKDENQVGEQKLDIIKSKDVAKSNSGRSNSNRESKKVVVKEEHSRDSREKCDDNNIFLIKHFILINTKCFRS